MGSHFKPGSGPCSDLTLRPQYSGRPEQAPDYAKTMANDRLAQLRTMLEEEPGDRFLRYAIALERKREGDLEGAAVDLESLLREDPTYIACYYQVALILADLGRMQEAIEACRSGALQCLVSGDSKARSELQALMLGLEEADEEA